MKVHLVKEKTIAFYAGGNSGSRIPLDSWLRAISTSGWLTPGDIPETFPSADLLSNGSDRVLFDIGGNNCRMICKYWLTARRVHLYVKSLATHAEYTRLCTANMQYTVED
jgi:mRNA interferase HigB